MYVPPIVNTRKKPIVTATSSHGLCTTVNAYSGFPRRCRGDTPGRFGGREWSPMDVLLTAGAVLCWGTVVLVWIAGAVRNAMLGARRPIRGEVDVTTTVVAVLASALVLTAGRGLAQNLTVSATYVRVLGLSVLAVSTAFALWARLSLGTSWSVGPRVGGDRQLRTQGPYAVTRHPIYTGLLGMLLGTTLLGGLGQWIVLVAVGLIAFEAKIRMEERLLLAVFPDEYHRYRAEVPQLIPGLRLPRRGG
jgi:protein-S-isoprenylcysteine O-methyltransferase Ste14